MKEKDKFDWKWICISAWLRWDDQSFKHFILQGVSLRQVVAAFGTRTSTRSYGYH